MQRKSGTGWCELLHPGADAEINQLMLDKPNLDLVAGRGA